MELEEGEDEEQDTNQYYCLSDPNASQNDEKVRWVWNKGLKLGKKVLVAGFVASSVPIVVPPLVVASAIGLAVSMPYAIFLASHACSQCLMSKLLPRPTPQLPPLLQEVSFQPHIDNKEEQAYLADETERDIEMVDAHNGSKKDDSGFFYEEEIALQQNDNNDVKLGVEVDGGMEGHLRRGSNEVKSMIDIGNEIDELKTLTTVVLEDQAIEEEDLQRETKGLLEKIRDEGRTDSTLRSGEYVEGGINENDSDKKIGPVVEDAQEDENGCIIGGTEEGNLRNEEDPNVCEEMLLLSRNDDTICNEVESDEPLLEGKEVDDINDSPKASDTIPTEPVLMQVYNISVPEELSEVTGDINIVVEEEPKHVPDGPATLQKEKLDNNISDSVNQESQLQEYDEMMDLSNADAREIALDLFDEKRIDPVEYAYAIGSHEG